MNVGRNIYLRRINECKFRHKQIKSYLFALLIISFNFGDYFKIAGRPFSQYISLALMLLSLVDLMGIYYRYKNLKKEQKIVLLFIALWAFVSLIQIIWVSDMASWKLGIRSLLINLFICFEMCVLFQEDEDYVLVMKSIEISLILSTAVGLCEIFTGVHFDSKAEAAAFGSEIRSFLGNPNDYATWIILCLLGVTLYYANQKRKYICMIEWIFGAYIIYHSKSRAGMLSVLVAVFFMIVGAILKAGRGTKTDSAKKQKAVHLLGIVSVIAGGGLYLIGGDIAAIIHSVSHSSSSDLYRLSIIEDSLGVAFKHVLIGAGANQTTFYVGINPHNFLLEILADYGILIAGMIIFILWKIFVRIFEAKTVRFYEIACYMFIPTFLLISIASSSMARLRMTWVVLFLYYFMTGEQIKQRKFSIKIKI